MSFVCSDSSENGVTKEKVRTNVSGKLPFSEYLGIQSNGLELSKGQILARTCGTIWWKKMLGHHSKKGFEKNEHACIVEGVRGFRIFLPVRYLKVAVTGGPDSENSKLVKAPTVPKLTSRNPGHATGAHWHRYIKLWEKRISSINFLMEQISDFRLSTKLSKIYHHQKDIIKQETIKSCWEFDLMTHFGQSWPVLGIAATGSR